MTDRNLDNINDNRGAELKRFSEQLWAVGATTSHLKGSPFKSHGFNRHQDVQQFFEKHIGSGLSQEIKKTVSYNLDVMQRHYETVDKNKLCQRFDNVNIELIQKGFTQQQLDNMPYKVYDKNSHQIYYGAILDTIAEDNIPKAQPFITKAFSSVTRYLDEAIGNLKITEKLIDIFMLGSQDRDEISHDKRHCICYRMTPDCQVYNGNILLVDPDTGITITERPIKPMPADWQKWYINGMQLPKIFTGTAFFGGHLLNLMPNAQVYVVNSELTAVIGTYVMPDKLWLAVGNKQPLTQQHIEILKDRNVICMPNAQSLRVWQKEFNSLKIKITDKLASVEAKSSICNYLLSLVEDKESTKRKFLDTCDDKILSFDEERNTYIPLYVTTLKGDAYYKAMAKIEGVNQVCRIGKNKWKVFNPFATKSEKKHLKQQ